MQESVRASTRTDPAETGETRATNSAAIDKRVNAAVAADKRADTARNRGVGNTKTLAAMEAENAKRTATGTQDIFGAQVATKLRRQLAASRSARHTGTEIPAPAAASSSSASAMQPPTEAPGAGALSEALRSCSTSYSVPPVVAEPSSIDTERVESLSKSVRSCRSTSDKAQDATPADTFTASDAPSTVVPYQHWASTASDAEASTGSTGSRIVTTNVNSDSSTCVWCLRIGVRTEPDSARCHDLQREFGCHRCDKIGCWTENPSCTFFRRAREANADSTTTGRAAPNMFERTPVQIRRERGTPNVLVEFSGHSFVKGFASGSGCNCLIHTLLSCLSDNGIPCMADAPWIRKELRKQFPQGANQVTERNFLDLRNHWRSIINLIGVNARRNSYDATDQIHARNFKVTAVLEDGRFVAEVDGDGPIDLYLLNEGNAHFVPLLRNRQR